MSEERNVGHEVNIEGTVHPWLSASISTEEIARLGGWDPSLGVILIDTENNEKTLKPGEVVELRHGLGFGKKIRWKRGANRVDSEIELLRERFESLEYDPVHQWIRIPGLELPSGWDRPLTDVAVQVPPGYPGTPPYGIHVPAGLRFNGRQPENYTESAANQPPFGGPWGMFSWTPSDGRWRATASVRQGANLLGYVTGFAERFREGV